jgi:hypothetical protein
MLSTLALGFVPEPEKSFISEKRQRKNTRQYQTQNQQFKDATKGLLDKDKRRALHDAISGEGLGFHEIKEMAKNIWIFFY